MYILDSILHFIVPKGRETFNTIKEFYERNKSHLNKLMSSVLQIVSVLFTFYGK